jgi:hypothetical protein
VISRRVDSSVAVNGNFGCSDLRIHNTYGTEVLAGLLLQIGVMGYETSSTI